MIKFSKVDRGFSLIEVAIAVMVIGIIISFTMKGKGLMESARLMSVVKQVNIFKDATYIFFDKYGTMPGDFPRAKEMISESLENGSGNGKIESINDVKRFWQQLSVSNILNVELVDGLPISKVGGCYCVSSNVSSLSGVWIILCGDSDDNASFSGILSPGDAWTIDKAHDTGDPLTGDIRVIKSSNATGDIISGGKYNVKNQNKDCVLLFRLF
ncbi:MAG: prepilin-type N-terminal cleavage/methylation domain-containing protein [Holosporaceae bacterium]|jgi:prepilin-type N-terminal cleavage/methylation domain-containing protein|nr:prepilin-type N-terminal cleavage/methylation domain-containing protein [Holosporaceae bacterium]